MRILTIVLALCLLTGCGAVPSPPRTEEPVPVITTAPAEFTSQFSTVTEIVLSDDGITVDAGEETESVYTTHDIVYYEDRDSYDSGNPYGEGEAWQRHSAEEAAGHTVVNITAPGTYRISGTLSAGQIRVDLGENACDDSSAVVNLILSDADITCTVAPAILFLNTYECDGNWSVDTAKPEVDTGKAGANLVLEGQNVVSGSHVARIYKDAEGEAKLWKQDGAIYSYMSLNIYGPGSLDLTADNEGLDTELHLTIHGGDIAIRSGNDGINTNEDGVSVTTINGGSLRILAGLGAEGDGIDSNGYLVINGGTVIAAANPAADAGLDSDLGSFINGGTVAAFGSTMDWAESDSNQVTINMQFAANQSEGSQIEIKCGDQTRFTFNPGADSLLKENPRQYSGAILSCPDFQQAETYAVYVDGIQQSYTGSDVARGPGGFGGGMPPQWNMPEGMEQPPQGDQRPVKPDGMQPPEEAQGMRPSEGMEPPDGMEFPGGMEPPVGMEPQEGFAPHRGDISDSQRSDDKPSTEFFMADKVNCFSGVAAAA